MEEAAGGEHSRQRSPHLRSTSCLLPEMLHQVWAAVLYLYGLLFNSMNQCPEHGQLTTLEVGEKEVWAEARRRGL